MLLLQAVYHLVRKELLASGGMRGVPTLPENDVPPHRVRLRVNGTGRIRCLPPGMYQNMTDVMSESGLYESTLVSAKGLAGRSQTGIQAR